ncbi:hypothetical protein GW17_00055707, partial [Ensete ventricosum]
FLAPEPSQLPTDHATQASATREANPPTKKTRVLVSKEAPRKDGPLVIAPRKATPQEAPREEENSKWRDKAVSRPWSTRDLYGVRAHSQSKPFLAQEIADLPKMFGEGPLEACWATLTPKSKVWADEADDQLFCRGVLCPPLVKEIYTTPSEALLDKATKNLVTSSSDHCPIYGDPQLYVRFREDEPSQLGVLVQGHPGALPGEVPIGRSAAASPAANRGDGAGRRGGRPLAG